MDRIPDKVVLQLKWVHQAQFAGFYLAQEQGYYAEEGIDVQFLEGGQDMDIAQSVVSGEADFAVLSPEDILINASQGRPLTAIAAIYRRSAVVFTSRAGSGIIQPNDFPGHKIAVLGKAGAIRDFEIQFRAMAANLGLPLSRMELIPYDPDYAGFRRGEIGVTAAYLTGGVIRLQQDGYTLNIFWPGDYGVQAYSDTLACANTLMTENPDLVTRFLRATLKGWRTAVGNPDLAVDDTLKYARKADRSLQTAMMEAQIPLVYTGNDHIGWMRAEDWQYMHDTLSSQGILGKPLNTGVLFTMSFLKRIYAGESE